MNKWQSKNNNESKNSNVYGTTDYKIPMFSYRSAFLIFGTTFIVTLLVIWLTNGNRQAIIVSLAACLSLTTAYAQYFIDRKLGRTKGFYITIAVLFAAVFIVLQFVQL